MRKLYHTVIGAAIAVMITATTAWPVAEDLIPDGVTSGNDANFATHTGGTACDSTSCELDVDNDPSTGDSTGVQGWDAGDGDCRIGDNDYFRVSLADPTGGNTAWNPGQTQTVEVRYMKCETGGGNPTMTISVWCNGDADASAQVVDASPISVTSTTETFDNTSVTFTDADVTCDPADIEVGIFCDGAGGSPTARRQCAIDSVRLAADVTEPPAVRRRIWGD